MVCRWFHLIVQLIQHRYRRQKNTHTHTQSCGFQKTRVMVSPRAPGGGSHFVSCTGNGGNIEVLTCIVPADATADQPKYVGKTGAFSWSVRFSTSGVGVYTFPNTSYELEFEIPDIVLMSKAQSKPLWGCFAGKPNASHPCQGGGHNRVFCFCFLFFSQRGALNLLTRWSVFDPRTCWFKLAADLKLGLLPRAEFAFRESPRPIPHACGKPSRALHGAETNRGKTVTSGLPGGQKQAYFSLLLMFNPEYFTHCCGFLSNGAACCLNTCKPSGKKRRSTLT